MASLKLTCPRTLVKHLGGLAGDVLNLKLKNNSGFTVFPECLYCFPLVHCGLCKKNYSPREVCQNSGWLKTTPVRMQC